MKNEVSINGVKLTRQQVEDALKELNKPEIYTPKVGDIFTIGSNGIYANTRFLAMDYSQWKFAFNKDYKAIGVIAVAIEGNEVGRMNYDFSTMYHKFVKASL